MRTLVTGASGFVGSAVARALLAAGHEVRVVVRKTSALANIADLPVERVEGDLLEPASLRGIMAGCDALFHVAADYRLWVPDREAMFRANVEGTRALMEEALTAGVKRVVYTSSVATLGSVPGGVADERTPVGYGDMIGPYKQSKFRAEEEVHRLIRLGLPAVIVNPSTPVGPRDIKPTPTGRLVRDAARGRIPAYVDTGLNIVHVDDVAQGHLLAYAHGRIGERYILGGDNLTLAAILTLIARIAGRHRCACRVIGCGRWRWPRRPTRACTSRRRRSSPGMSCAWPPSTCSSIPRRPAPNSATTRVPRRRRWPMPWRGFSRADTPASP